MLAPPEEKYWDSRANLGYIYKRERFYTITPAPYYYERRKVIISKIRTCIVEEKCQSVCDFACGDGAYIQYLSDTGATFHGVDISEEMISLAKKKLENSDCLADFEISSSGISEDKMFDMIYSSAVWAHVSDSVMGNLMKNICDHTKKEGLFVICEQTAPCRYAGNGWTRRTCNDYMRALQKAGFSIMKAERIDFWLHRVIMEKHLVKWVCSWKRFSNDTRDKTRIALNQNRLYLAISWILTKLSIPNVFCGNDGWGYCFIIARKN